MSLNTIVVQGTLKPDGTLELDEKPSLAPGRVQVMLQPASIGLAVRGGLAWGDENETAEATLFPSRSVSFLGLVPRWQVTAWRPDKLFDVLIPLYRQAWS